MPSLSIYTLLIPYITSNILLILITLIIPTLHINELFIIVIALVTPDGLLSISELPHSTDPTAHIYLSLNRRSIVFSTKLLTTIIQVS